MNAEQLLNKIAKGFMDGSITADTEILLVGESMPEAIQVREVAVMYDLFTNSRKVLIG